jgi:nucleoside-diphosphate-sugar epimerase
MNILITGGAGFIGSEFAKFCLKNSNHVVKILDNLEYGYRDNFSDNKKLTKNFILKDIRDKDINKFLKKIDVVIHLAAISSLPECEVNPQKAFDVNVNGLVNLLNACRNSKVKRFIFASTSAVYENNISSKKLVESDLVSPNLIYATTKYCAELFCRSYAQNYGMDIVICRFFNVFGAHQDFKRKYPPFTSYLVREIINNRVPTIYNVTNVKRDYIYVDDLNKLLSSIINAKKHYAAEVFNLCSGQGYTTLEISKIIFDILNKKFVYQKGNSLTFWDKYEILFNKNFNLHKSRVEKEVYKHCIGSTQKTLKEFKFKPKTELASGLAAIIQYQKDQNKFIPK